MRSLRTALTLAACAAGARAEVPGYLNFDPSHVGFGAPAEAGFNAGGNRGPFGAAGTTWLTFGGGVADDFDQSTDYSIHGAWSWFMVDDLEFGAEGSLWHFDQEGGAAEGAGFALLLRWHFVSRPGWSIFTDAGLGVLASTDDVPADGTSLNFMPRAGAGATFRIADDGTRLQVGLRWHHISNARINGDVDNPGRDGPMLYAGIMIPF